MVKNLPVMQETWVWSLGWENPLENGTATHASILAWRIPWTEEPGRLQSWGCRVWHDWANFPFTSVSGSKQNCAEGTEISMCSLPPWKHVFPHFNIQPILKLDKLISVTDTKEEFRFSPNPVIVSFSSLCWMLEPPPPISQSRPERWWGT